MSRTSTDLPFPSPVKVIFSAISAPMRLSTTEMFSPQQIDGASPRRPAFCGAVGGAKTDEASVLFLIHAAPAESCGDCLERLIPI